MPGRVLASSRPRHFPRCLYNATHFGASHKARATNQAKGAKMNTTTAEERSFETIEPADLLRLVELANKGLEQIFEPRGVTAQRYKDQKPLLLCLCQGAAKHFVHRNHGVKDFDVWAFYAEHPEGQLLSRYTRYNSERYAKVVKPDFGPSKFGRNPDDHGYQGRRVDILCKSIPLTPGQSMRDGVLQWLREGRGRSSAKLLAQRPVIVISEGRKECNEIIWDPGPD